MKRSASISAGTLPALLSVGHVVDLIASTGRRYGIGRKGARTSAIANRESVRRYFARAGVVERRIGRRVWYSLGDVRERAAALYAALRRHLRAPDCREVLDGDRVAVARLAGVVGVSRDALRRVLVAERVELGQSGPMVAALPAWLVAGVAALAAEVPAEVPADDELESGAGVRWGTNSIALTARTARLRLQSTDDAEDRLIDAIDKRTARGRALAYEPSDRGRPAGTSPARCSDDATSAPSADEPTDAMRARCLERVRRLEQAAPVRSWPAVTTTIVATAEVLAFRKRAATFLRTRAFRRRAAAWFARDAGDVLQVAA